MNFYIKSNTHAITSIIMDIIIGDVFGLRENIFPSVVTNAGIWIIAPVSEHSHRISYPQAGCHPRSLSPEVIANETGEVVAAEIVVPKPDGGLSIVILEGADATLFLRPQVNHFSDSNSPWVRENASEIDSEETADRLGQSMGVVRSSRKDTSKLILEPIVSEEQGSGLEEVSHKEGEAVLEQEIRTFFERNSSKSIQIRCIASL